MLYAQGKEQAQMKYAMGRWRALGMFAMLIMLVGCGKTVTSGNGGAVVPTATPGGGVVKPVPSLTPLPVGTVQATGCPLPTKTVTWPPPPPLHLSPQKSHAASLRVGQTLEVDLPFGHRWALALPQVPSGSLSLDAPAGYGDAAQHSCVWHYTAKAAGQVTLTYSLSPLCQKGQHCSGAITLLDLAITVQA